MEDQTKSKEILDLFKEIKVKHLLLLIIPGSIVAFASLKLGIVFINSFNNDNSDSNSIWNKSLFRRNYDE